jgi:hypothetical protein
MQKEFGGLTVKAFPFEQRFARFDLEVQLVEADQEMYGTVLYNTDLFDRATMVRMIEHFQVILEATVNAPSEHLSSISAKIPAQTLSVEVISVFTAEPLEESLSFWMEKLRIPARIRFAPYNQVFQKLMDPVATRGAVRIILLRLEDWANSKSDSDEGFVIKLERNVRDFLDVLKTSSGRQGSTYLVCLCPESNALTTNLTRIASLRDAENLIRQSIKSMSDVYLIDHHDVVKLYDVDEVNDPTADELGHVPYTPDFFTALGTSIMRKILSLQLPDDPGTMTTVLKHIWSSAPVKNEKVVVDVARAMQKGRIALPMSVRQNTSQL